MGLPHIISGNVANAPMKYGVPDLSINPDWNKLNNSSISNNAMLPGPALANPNLGGTSITESQIEHIRNNSEFLNRTDVSGSSTTWGQQPSDRPVYQFNYNSVNKTVELLNIRQ